MFKKVSKKTRRGRIRNQTITVPIAFKQLTFNGQTRQWCPIKCTSFPSESKNNVLQWGFTWNSAPAAAGNCI
jgi:hypothetical protein